MAYVRLQVLGGLTVTVGGHLLALARSCRPIVGYLVTHRQRQVSRVELAEAYDLLALGSESERHLEQALVLARTGGFHEVQHRAETLSERRSQRHQPPDAAPARDAKRADAAAPVGSDAVGREEPVLNEESRAVVRRLSALEEADVSALVG